LPGQIRQRLARKRASGEGGFLCDAARAVVEPPRPARYRRVRPISISHTGWRDP
jgi:hypothetical protein